jgi:poly-gamma-glutamate capsule biosynthesis protein CapA/YwtB (metallophosphatase superfamily)
VKFRIADCELRVKFSGKGNQAASMSAKTKAFNLLFIPIFLLGACSFAGGGAHSAAPPAAFIAPTQAAPLSPTLAEATAATTSQIPPAAAATQGAAPAPSPTPAPPATAAPSATLPSEALTTLDFTGVIVPARCVQAAIDQRRDHDYLYTEVRGLLSAADLAVGTFNAAMSAIPPHTGCVRTYLLVGDPHNAEALARAGFDLMSVATNHIKNCGVSGCGDQAFFDTLDNLRRAGIQTVGAGANLQEAAQPLVVSLHGVRFGFVSLGQIEQSAFAGPQTPGIAVLTDESLRAAIAAARQVSDVVIAMPHWGPEDAASPNYIQRGLAQAAVQAGADLVVGNHTHVVQALQVIDGVPVFYGLGNFVFDQGLPDHKQGAILRVTFRGARLAGFELLPTHVDQDGTVHIAGPLEAAQVLARLAQASQALGYNESLRYVASLPASAVQGLADEQITRRLVEQYLEFYRAPELSGAQGRISGYEIQSLAAAPGWQAQASAINVGFIANVVYGVKPVYAPAWEGGERTADGWMRNLSLTAGYRQVGDRCELVILGAGP